MRHPPPVVRSAWIEDSVRARRKLPVAEYMVDGIFVQKGTLAASFAAGATPKKLPPPSSSSSRRTSDLSSGDSMCSSKARASSEGAGESQLSRLVGTRPNDTSGPNGGAVVRLTTPSSHRHMDSRSGGDSSSADHGVSEGGRRPGRGLKGTETAVAARKSTEVGAKGPVVSTAPSNVGSGGGSSHGGGGLDAAPAAPLLRSAKEQPAVAVRKQLDDVAVATPAPHTHASGKAGKRTPSGDNGNGKHRGTLRLYPTSGENRDEPTLPRSKDSEDGDGDGGAGGAGGGSNGFGVGGHKGATAEGEVPPWFELPEMGAAGGGGRSTKDDPAFMKTFFRNSRLHFIGVG